MSSMIAGVHYPNGMGELICQICIEWTKVEDLYVDDKGDRWDVCRPCGIEEEKHVEIVDYKYGVQGFNTKTDKWQYFSPRGSYIEVAYDSLESATRASIGFKSRYGGYGLYTDFRVVRFPIGEMEVVG